MKKIFTFILLLVLVTGCWNKDTIDEEKLANYQAHVDSLIKHGDENSFNIPFDYKVDLAKLKNGTYRYDITIDNPRVAMYNVEVLALDKKAINQDNEMFPNAGILDDEAINMIPNQGDTQKGYHKGILISGISKTEEFKVNVVVSFKDYAKLKQFRYYFSIDCKYKEPELETAGE